MAKWLERTKPVVPVCLTFGPAMAYERFWLGPVLLVAGLLWLWFEMDDQRRTSVAPIPQRLETKGNPYAWVLYFPAGGVLFALNWRGGGFSAGAIVAQVAIAGLMLLAIMLARRPTTH